MAYDGIVDVIKERLGVTSPIMKYFDTDVDEYIDLELDSCDFVKDYKVLKVKVSQGFSEREDTLNAANNHDSQEAASSSQTRTIPGPLSPTRSGSPSRPSTPQYTQSRPHTPVNTTPSPHSRPLSPLIRNVTPTGLSATSHKRSGKSWPKKYTFPVESIPRSVQQQFDLKQPLPKKEMRMFMDTLYLDITKYDGGLYPSSEMYEEIVDAILGAHPYLLKVDGLPLVSVRAYWKGKLVYKFGNSRKRHDGNLPEVVERKRKKEKEPERKEGGILTWGLENYSPSQSISEDEASINSHKEWMLREWRRSEPDLNILDMKMDLTFPSRRSLILKEATVKEVIQEYPWLQSHRQLLREFVRLGPNVRVKDIEELLYDGLARYMEAIVRLSRKKKCIKQLQEMHDALSIQRIESQRKYTSQCCAVLGIAVLFREKTERILYFGDDTAEETQLELHVRQGVLTVDNKAFYLKLEGSILFECDTFLELICGLIATIYAFNLVYPKVWEKTLTFIQNVILGLKDGDNVDKRIVSVLTDINRESQSLLK
ncbi:unnamed protein product [Mytilus coruscus]|uniref:Uncharacterized protein n=1 Tax=Mytilus coruscus TaxID=42192 RepID=A0A6J8EJJ9_MYTCO|nr:unnamed protein product [Mytilus coruscus]